MSETLSQQNLLCTNDNLIIWTEEMNSSQEELEFVLKYSQSQKGSSTKTRTNGNLGGMTSSERITKQNDELQKNIKRKRLIGDSVIIGYKPQEKT